MEPTLSLEGFDRLIQQKLEVDSPLLKEFTHDNVNVTIQSEEDLFELVSLPTEDTVTFSDATP